MCVATGAARASASATCARPPTGSPMCCARTGVKRGDRVAIFMPQAPEVAAAHIAIYKLGAVALPVAILFGPDALQYRLQNSGAKALLTNAQGLGKFDEIRAQVPDVTCVLSVDGAASPICLAKALVRFHAGRHRRRRSGDDDLHLGHHRPAERRAACPSRAARPSARRRAAALSVSASGRQLLDAGRLGLGRRPARRAAAEPASRRAGDRAPLRQVRSGGSLRADGQGRRAQRLHSADRAAHDARGAEPARPLRFQAAQHGLGRRVARHRGAGMGQGGLRADHQRVLRPDRMQSGARLLRAARHVQGPAPSASRCRAIRWR